VVPSAGQFNERDVKKQPSPLDNPQIWVLDFRFKDPRLITVDVPGRGKKVIWYMWYQVINNTGEARTFIPDFELVTLDKRTVHHDQVGRPLALELLDLAQDEDVADARNGRRHHVEDTRASQALGHPAQAMVLEVLDEGVIGGEPTSPHPGRQLGLLVAQVGGHSEGSRDAGLALELHDEDGAPGPCSHAGQGRAHGRLAHAALAGDQEDMALSTKGRHVHARPSVVA